ncbi:MAG: hypothetical protein A4E63_00248 [Syntrophorhabdus sp. PtaU1.Bin050]|nr:MAG: hypothetical protein A4E63_00248 [Syntrophorhabdus sp. PtaU1.Bin050]
MGRLHDKMVVISHEDIGMEDYTKLMTGFREIGKKFIIIFCREKYLLLIIAPCSHMIEGTFIFNTEWTGHRYLLRRVMEASWKHYIT